MRNKKNREINVFSLSAVDLFASALGVFIIVTVVLIPYMTKKESKRNRVVEAKLREEVNELKTTLSQLTQTGDAGAAENAEQKVIALTQQVSSLTTQLKQSKKVQDSLKSQIQKSSLKQNNEGGFIVAIVKWSSPKHDVDLQVQDPAGRLFNFKRRKYKGVPGGLILDTRTGPGVEVWQSSKLQEGIYKLRYLFYGKYGNPAPVSVEGTIITPPGETKLPKVVLKQDKQKSPWFQLKVSSDGKVQIL